jgi:predicted nucleotidyltransferase
LGSFRGGAAEGEADGVDRRSSGRFRAAVGDRGRLADLAAAVEADRVGAVSAAETLGEEELQVTGEAMEKQLNQLTGRLTKAFGERLVSVILFGSAASGEFEQNFSDLNILCVVEAIGPAELEAAEPIVRWWREAGNPSPLLLAGDEVATSTDCFPIEFEDMLARRRVLQGRDVIAGLEIDRSFYRAQVEYQLRAALIRLRQKAAGVLKDSRLLGELMVDSVATFLVLARHVLLLSGHKVEAGKRATLEGLEAHTGLDAAPFRTLLDVRQKKAVPGQMDAKGLFARYLKSVHELVNVVDALEK